MALVEETVHFNNVVQVAIVSVYRIVAFVGARHFASLGIYGTIASGSL
jgi:hypothetical protein